MLSRVKTSSGFAQVYAAGLTACLCAALSIASPNTAWAAPPSAPVKPAQPKPSADKATGKNTNAKPAPPPEPVLENVLSTTAEDLTNRPEDFVGKNVKFTANFFAFSNLALDYKPAFKSSKTHLSFLILRSNSHIPLSELKLAMMIPKEKDPESTLLATLKDGDQLEMVGKVFSAALDEPWVEVFKVKKLNTAQEEKKSVAAGTDSSASSKSGDEKPAPGKEEKPQEPKSKSNSPSPK